MKKYVSLLSILILFFCLCSQVSAGVLSDMDRSEVPLERKLGYFTDEADLLTPSQGQSLDRKLEEITDRQHFGVSIVTLESLDGGVSQTIAEEILRYYGLGYGQNQDGILLIISMEYRDWAIATQGLGDDYFTEYGLRLMINAMAPALQENDFDSAFQTFANICDQYITEGTEAQPYNENHKAYDLENNIREVNGGASSSNDLVKDILIALVIGFVIGGIAILISASKLKSVRFQSAANNYLRPGSLNVTYEQDVYLYQTESRTRRNVDNDSSRGGGGGGVTFSGSSHGASGHF